MKRNQKGFGVIEILLVLVIVGLIGFIGWYIWNNNNKTETNNSNTATSNSSVATTTVKIPYFGIQITVPNTISDLTFYSSESNLGFLDVSTAKLASLDAACTVSTNQNTANGSALGLLTSPSNKDANTVAQIPHNGGGNPYSYINYTKPDKSCTSDPKVLATLTQYREEFVKSFSTIKPIQ